MNIDNTHWALAVAHMPEKKIRYLDSMTGTGKHYLKGILRCDVPCDVPLPVFYFVSGSLPLPQT